MRPDKLKLLEAMLIRHEGMRLKPYKCTEGYLTIGVGRNLDTNGLRQSEAMFMLDNDIEATWSYLVRRYPWFSNLILERQVALADMCFQLGQDGFAKFTNSLGLIANKNYSEARTEMLKSLWANQAPKRADEITKIIEQGVFLDGRY